MSRNFTLLLTLFLAAAPRISSAHDGDAGHAVLTAPPLFEAVGGPAPEFDWITAEGIPVSRSDFLGRTVVLNFVYLRCNDVCIDHSRYIASLQAVVARSEVAGSVAFVSVVTDTEDPAETLELMAGYGARHGLQPASWRLLRAAGDETGIGQAARLGQVIIPTGAGAQLHPLVSYVIDPLGNLAGRLHGIGMPSDSVAALLEHLAQEGSLVTREAPPEGGVNWWWVLAGSLALAMLATTGLIRLAVTSRK